MEVVLVPVVADRVRMVPPVAPPLKGEEEGGAGSSCADKSTPPPFQWRSKSDGLDRPFSMTARLALFFPLAASRQAGGAQKTASLSPILLHCPFFSFLGRAGRPVPACELSFPFFSSPERIYEERRLSCLVSSFS